MAFVDHQVRDARHARPPVGARKRLDAAEDERPVPVVLLGLDHRAWRPVTFAMAPQVLLDQLVGVLQHQDSGIAGVVHLLADVEAGDGGLSCPGWQHEHGVAVGRGVVARGIHAVLLIVAGDHGASLSAPRRARRQPAGRGPRLHGRGDRLQRAIRGGPRWRPAGGDGGGAHRP